MWNTSITVHVFKKSFFISFKGLLPISTVSSPRKDPRKCFHVFQHCATHEHISLIFNESIFKIPASPSYKSPRNTFQLGALVWLNIDHMLVPSIVCPDYENWSELDFEYKKETEFLNFIHVLVLFQENLNDFSVLESIRSINDGQWPSG